MTEDVSRRSIAGAAGVVIFALALAFTLLAAAPPAAANNATPNTYGKTIGNWGHAWWQWATNFSTADNPIEQPIVEDGQPKVGYVDCTAGQSGAVWFLAGTFGGEAVRTCSVQQGKALFFPIINTLWWYPEDCQEVEECREVAASFINPSTSWTCEINGKPCIYTNQVVRAQSDALRYYIPVDSWLTELKDADGNPIPIAAGVRDFAISDGYWVMLPPLSRGEHTIRFSVNRAGFDFVTNDGETEELPEFALDVTYHLTVTSRP
jgi:hypothetical protein